MCPELASIRMCRISSALVAAVLLAACANGSAMVGLPAEDFERAYAAGYDVAAAERCGAAVDAGRIRHALVEDVRRRGGQPPVADKAGRTFDKTRSEFASKLQARPDFCVTEYAVTPERLAQYDKGEFSAAR